jgi:hypothetical protein
MMTLSALDELRVQLKGQMVLSAYIAAGQHSPTERSHWRILLQQQLDSLGAASGKSPEFDRARALLEADLARFRGFLPGAGWVAYATADKLWSCEQVPAPVPDLVRWRRGMVLAPYLRVLKQARPVVLALVDSKRARLFLYQAGHALEPVDSRADTFIDDLTDRNMSKRAATHSGVRGATATDAADRVLHVEMERMLKQVAAEVLTLAGRDGLVVIGGPTAAVSALQHLLLDRLGDRLTVDESTFMAVSDTAARATIERCVSALSHRLQHKAVTQILDGVGSTGRGAVGLQDTAAAVAVGQVEALLLTRRFLHEHEADAEHLIARTLELGGRADEVTGEAAELLETRGEGVAARLRFAAQQMWEPILAQ